MARGSAGDLGELTVAQIKIITAVTGCEPGVPPGALLAPLNGLVIADVIVSSHVVGIATG